MSFKDSMQGSNAFSNSTSHHRVSLSDGRFVRIRAPAR
jgi:hypothetical protein